MQITLIISEDCKACDRAKVIIEEFYHNHPNLNIEIIDINFCDDRRISITPALLIDRQLFSYGDIDEAKLSKKLN